MSSRIGSASRLARLDSVWADGRHLAPRGLSNYPLRQRPVLLARRTASRTLDAVGLRHPWVKHRPNPAEPRLLPRFRLFAVLGTWMEADVVEATVKNAFAQGCDRVFLVDNDSPDDTVATAIDAGAELARAFSMTRHDEDARIRIMNEVVNEVSSADGSKHIWWLWLDADEFPHGPSGQTIREFLATLDDSFRIVGTRYLNHYPSGDPAYVPGFHPLDFQSLAEELTERRCWLWHRKHQLQRFDRGAPAITCESGFHWASCAQRPLLEPTDAILLHHTPYRDRETTFRRLDALFSTQSGTSRADPADSPAMIARMRSFDAVYAQNWDAVDIGLAPGLKRPRARPRPWTDLVEPEHHRVKRWYSAERLDEAIARGACQAA